MKPLNTNSESNTATGPRQPQKKKRTLVVIKTWICLGLQRGLINSWVGKAGSSTCAPVEDLYHLCLRNKRIRVEMTSVREMYKYV